MKRIRPLRYACLLLMLGLFLGCQNTDPDDDLGIVADHAALLALNKAWAAAAAVGDTSRVLTHWTDDAVNFFPGAPAAVGKQAIRQLVKRNRSQPGFSIKSEPKQAFVSSAEDLGYTSGTFQVTVDGPTGTPVTRNGNYVNIWKKQPDGSWKCAVTIGSPSG